VSPGSNRRFCHNHNLCLQLVEPDLVLLRNHSTTRHMFIKDQQLDRLALEQLMFDPPYQLSTIQQMSLIYLSDQFRHIPRTTDQRLVQLNQQQSMNSIICTAKLCKMHKHVLQASYYAPLSNKNFKRMCHLFSKVLNIRCQSRKFPIVALRYMNENKITSQNMLHIFCLSLLGNYPHVKSYERPIGETRVAIYHLFYDSNPDGYELFLTLIKKCSLLMVNAMREFILFSIDCHPWLKKHLTPLMNLERFSTVVLEAMKAVRDYFQLFLCDSHSALYACCFKQNAEALKRVLWDLNICVNPSHAAMLAISYRRPNLNPASFITANRKRFPLVRIPTEDDLKNAEWEAQTEEQFSKWIEEQMQMFEEDVEDEEDVFNEPFVLEEKKQQLEQEELEELEDADETGLQTVLNQVRQGVKKTIQKKVEDLDLWKYIKYSVYQALQAIVQRQQPTETGAFYRCLRWLVHFGVQEEVIQYIHVIITHYEYGTMSIEKLKYKFTQLQRYEPYAYTLIQITAELIKECERHYHWYSLPYHYVAAQMEALMNRFSITKESRILLESNLYLVFCEICGTDYSLIRVFANQKTNKKTYNQYYRCGFRDVVVDYETNLMYCKRNKCTVKGRCGEKPLSQFPILGKAFWKDGKCYLICGQIDCGLKMEYDPDQCMFTSRGIACSDCTLKAKQNPKEYTQLVQQYTTTERKCFKCGAMLEKGFETHLLPVQGVYLCQKHSKPWLLREIEKKFADQEQIQRTELEQFIIQISQEYSTRFKDKNEARNKQMLKQFKKAQSFKRVRR
jgi:hypothetical protein